MATETVVANKGIYFITFTCHHWLPLIDAACTYSDVYNFFAILKQKGHSVVGYVIMPNHVHLLLHYSGKGATLNLLIGNGKRFLAYSIVKKLQQKALTDLLSALREGVEPKDKARGKLHEVWKPGFDVKPCRTEKFLLQKLNYIHDNPVRGKRKLAPDNASYEHSSCLFYFHQKQRHFEVNHYQTLLDW
ncbi:MAG: hypothetical protein EOO06_21705, partial [Chitinophagaceae bacterium]